MNKNDLLQELAAQVKTGLIKPEEVLTQLQIVSPSIKDVETKKSSHFSVTKMLYVLGGAIVIIGVIIFVGQIWSDLGAVGKIFMTLGLGLIFSLLGSMLLLNKPDNNIGAVFHIIGGVLIPSGAMVTLGEFSVRAPSLWSVAFTFAAIFIFYLILSYIHKNAILTFFALANGTVFIYTLIGAVLTDSNIKRDDEVMAYLTMLVGASYLLLAQAFRGGWNKHLVAILYFFGSAALLGAGFSQVFEYPIWELLFFIFVVGAIFLSIYFHSRIILVVSTLFLIAHLSYITGEYFADSLGWPISLVILGFVFIGLGYASITIGKKYITK